MYQIARIALSRGGNGLNLRPLTATHSLNVPNQHQFNVSASNGAKDLR